MICLDTNVLIEILKGNEHTVNSVNAFDQPLAISSITTMELYYGAHNKAELKKLEKFTSHFRIVHLDETISLKAVTLIHTYAKSHTLNIPDALIAATALVYRLPLMTYNIKDFHFIPDLELIGHVK